MTRKIDKRACRKFAMPELEFNLNEGVLHVESCPYIIRTAVRNIAGQRILVLYIYQRESILAGSIKPRWVMFHSRDDFATLSFREDAKATWQCSTLGSLDRIGGFDSKCAFYRQQDESRVARFCKCERGAISMLGYLQRLISYRKELERKWKKQRAIIDRMKYVPVLPRDLNGFIHREVMPQYIFYDYQRKAPGHAYCTACRHEVRIAAAKHNTSGLCPRCKKKITFKCRGRRGRIFDRETVQVLQKTESGEMLLRIIKVYRAFTGENTPAYYSIYENARYYLASAGKDDLTPWKCGYRPRFLSWYESFEASAEGKLYPNNLAEFLRDTPWKYSQLETYARTVTSMEAITYLNAFARWPMIEYLVKLKLFRLVRDVVYSSLRYTMSKTINCEGRNLQDVLGFDRSWIPLLQEVNPGIAQLRIIRAFIGAGKKLDASMMKWCADNAVQDASVLTELLSYTSMHKLCRYADAQYEGYRKAAKVWYCEVERSMANLLTDYCDYLRMCKELQYDVKNSFVLFPHMLKDAHDSAAKTLKDKRTAEQEKAIGDSFDEWQKRYQYQSKELMMIPPHSAKEITREGDKLHHCVGRYVKDVVKNNTTILFIRKASAPKKPYCTVEVKHGDVIQARIQNNVIPPPKVKRFIESWKENVLYAPALERAA